MATWRKRRPLRILDLDIENRPLTYLGNDYTTSDITAIAWMWVGERQHYALALGEVSRRTMLLGIVTAYVAADQITGHNVRHHDLRLINGALLEEGLSPLPTRLVCDTYADLKKKSGVSGSQESLAAMLGVKAPKFGMSQTAWRQANRLEPDGIALTKKRVVADVRQHVALRAKLLELGWLKPPRPWTP